MIAGLIAYYCGIAATAGAVTFGVAKGVEAIVDAVSES